uniref:Uncharacterized protein n=1 Tax=Meloidogyne enterolobii TaxID=390850 RepID=A0A6V7TTE9_MELEN|nr:unnamed protein product [Meloidogyne enterolobii]
MPSIIEKYFHLQILKSAEYFDNDIAIIDISTGCSLTFSDIYNKSIQLSSVLHQFKFLKPKDVVLCVLNNNIYFPVILLGFALNGILVTGASPNSTIG